MIDDYRDLFKGWNRAYCYVFQQANDEAYVYIPDVIVYDEDSGEFRHRHFLGFKGFDNQDPEGYYFPATFPVFASHQPSFSSQSVVTGAPLELDFEWCDEEWRNGQRLVEALCGQNWSDYALGCKEEVVATDSTEFHEWVGRFEASLKKHRAFDFDDVARSLLHFPNIPDDVDDIDFVCADNGLIDTLESLRPIHGLVDRREVVSKGWVMWGSRGGCLSDYGLVAVGKPLVYEHRWAELDLSLSKQLDDGSFEPVKISGYSESGRGLHTVSARGLCVKWIDEAAWEQVLGPDGFDMVVSICKDGDFLDSWNKKNGDFLNVCLYKVEEIRRGRYGLRAYEEESLRSVVAERHPLARIPITHYKNGRHVVQWKKAIDIRFDGE